MKLKKRIIAVVLSCVALMNTISLPVQAATPVNETEPNNTRETAMTITANRETPAQAVSGSKPNQYVVDGYTSSDDDDWFKVYLNAGTQYLTLNGDSYFNYEVYSESGFTPIIEGQYIKTGFGSRAYGFTAATAGYYYVRLYTNLSSALDYSMLVGDPVYTVASCTVELGDVTISGSDRNVPVNLVSEADIPEDAIVYIMTVRNVRSTAVSGIAVSNRTTDNTINLDRYTWSKSGLVSLSMPVRSNWQITFQYSQDITLTPTITFYYVYPVTSEYVENDITIIL